MNLGVADYDGLPTLVAYRGHSKMSAALRYTLAKATNTAEPDGNGSAPRFSICSITATSSVARRRDISFSRRGFQPRLGGV